MASIYSENYYTPWKVKGKIDFIADMKKGSFFNYMNLIESHAEDSTHKRVLDVGRATGFFLEVAKQRGWEPYGVEISEYSSEFARQKLGNTIFKGLFEIVLLRRGQID